MLQDLLLANLRTQPDATAVITLERQWSYAELGAESAGYCRALQAVGVLPGATVVIFLANGAQAVAAYFGILLAEAVVVPLDVRNPDELLAGQIRNSAARFLISQPRFAQRLDNVQSLLEPATPMQRILAPLQDMTPMPALATAPTGAGLHSPAVIFYTSGSSGLPKGVVLSHNALLSNTAAIVQSLALNSQDRVLHVLPLSYCYGASLLHTHFAVGGSIVFDARMAYPAAVLEHMCRTGCTGFAGVPFTLRVLARSCASLQQTVPSLRYVTCAGGALDPALADTIRRSLWPAQLFVMYGLTEAGARLTCLDPAQWERKPGSVGMPIAGIELRVLRSDGDLAGPEEVGEILARGDCLMRGYLHDPLATAQTLRGGWLHTGDLGYLDADGFLYITGRLSGFIKRNGYRLDPQLISQALLSHPEVSDAVTLGLPDPAAGERIAALVCLHEGSSLDAQGLLQYCRSRLPAHMFPDQLRIVTALPRLGNGKPDYMQAQRMLLERG